MCIVKANSSSEKVIDTSEAINTAIHVLPFSLLSKGQFTMLFCVFMYNMAYSGQDGSVGKDVFWRAWWPRKDVIERRKLTPASYSLTSIHTLAHWCTHTRTCVHTHESIHPHAHTCTHMCTHTCEDTHMHTRECAHTCTRVHTHASTHMHTRERAHTHAHVYTREHTHMHIRVHNTHVYTYASAHNAHTRKHTHMHTGTHTHYQ